MKKKYSKKKYIIIGGVLAMILIIGFVFAKDYVSLNKKTLKRDYDTEFEQGSNIKTQELSECQVESLYKLCKVWGYAKYHHPDVISGEVNWDAELFRVMPDVLNAANATDVNHVLLEWQESIRYIMDSGCRFFGRGVKRVSWQSVGIIHF